MNRISLLNHNRQEGATTLTCVQRRVLKLDTPPGSRRQVSKPTSIMRSRTMSVQSETMMLSVLAVVLGTTQVFVIGDQALWSW